MRVALVNNFFPPRPSGSAHITEELARRLTARGFDVLVLTASYAGAPADERRDGYRVVRLPSRVLPQTTLSMRFDISFAFSPRNLRRLFELLDGFAPDVIHQHGQFFDLTFMSSFYARRRRVPVVLSVHTRLEHPSRPHALALWLADMTLVRAFMALSRPHVIVTDTLMQHYIRRRYRLPASRTTWIPVGVDPSQFRGLGDGQQLRERLDIGDRPVVLSLGHVIFVRDRIPLIEALPALLEKRPDVAVVVVGTVYDDRFARRAEELGVRHALVVTGGVPRDAIRDYLAIAAVETHDLQGYGLGTTSLEAMAAGVPVVAVVQPDNYPGVELRSGRNLVIVPPHEPRALADAILRLLDEPAWADEVARGEQQLIDAHFTLDRIVDEHVAVYERVGAS